MNKLLVVCGPTATGKTSLALKLAKNFDGEIVSADSRQVYKGMNIGTGKDLPENSKFQFPNSKHEGKDIGFYDFDGTKVWLLDVVEPDYRFSVADWLKCAKVAIRDIQKRGKLPIIVGGTGFYIKTLLEGIDSLGIEPDWELRKRLSNLAIEQLRQKLAELDSNKLAKMNESDRNNPRRLTRAIEIALKVKSEKLKVKSWNSKPDADTMIIGLHASLPFIYKGIDKRVEERVKNGIEEEIKNLLAKGYDFENSALGTTLAYKQWRPLFGDSMMQSDKASGLKEKIIGEWKNDEHSYARRQMTWFRKMVGIKWMDTEKRGWKMKIVRLVSPWYSERADGTKKN